MVQEKILSEAEIKKHKEIVKHQIGWFLDSHEKLRFWGITLSKGRLRFSVVTDMLTKYTKDMIEKDTGFHLASVFAKDKKRIEVCFDLVV